MLHDLTEAYLAMSRQYPAVVGIISIWMLTVASFLGRNLPKKVWAFIRQKFICSIHLDEASNGMSGHMVNVVCDWVRDNMAKRKIRIYQLMKHPVTDEPTFILGDGTFSFWYRKHFFIVSVATEKMETWNARQVRISTFGVTGRSFNPIKDLILQAAHTTRTRGIYKYNNKTYANDWDMISPAPERNIHSLVYADDALGKIIADISKWRSEKDFYEKFNIPHKKCYVLEGPPGTGKTSLLQAVASHFKSDIYSLSLSLPMTDTVMSSLVAGLTKTPTFKILLIEDFDSLSSLHVRSHEESSGTQKDKEKLGVTLQGFLNCFGGLVPLSNIVIFMTTNHIEKIDPAVIRPGRVDKIVHIGYLEDADIRKYILYRYNSAEVKKYLQTIRSFEKIRGCDLENMFIETLHKPMEFINSIPTEGLKTET